MRRTPAQQLSPQRVGRSSSVISGTSLRHDRCFRAVTIADLRGLSSVAGAGAFLAVVTTGSRWRSGGVVGCASSASLQAGGLPATSPLRPRLLAKPAAAALFRPYHCRAGDLGQRPPLPLRRRLVAVGRGDDAGHCEAMSRSSSGVTNRRLTVATSRSGSSGPGRTTPRPSA